MPMTGKKECPPVAQHELPTAYFVPRALDEAAQLLRAGNVTVLAGGTDVMPQSKTGRIRCDGVVRLGALTTITELLESSLVRARFNALWQACDHFASDQLRNAATIGGNICNASPAGDTLVPLLIFNARVLLASKPNGALMTRSVALAEFFDGPGRTKCAANELLVAIEIPLPPASFVSEFYKFGVRPALDIAAISIGFGAARVKDTFVDVRLAFGAVASTPIRAPKTEAALDGKILAAALDAALDVAEAEIHPISDIRASAWYRRELVRNMLRRMLEHVGER